MRIHSLLLSNGFLHHLTTATHFTCRRRIKTKTGKVVATYQNNRENLCCNASYGKILTELGKSSSNWSARQRWYGTNWRDRTKLSSRTTIRHYKSSRRLCNKDNDVAENCRESDGRVEEDIGLAGAESIWSNLSLLSTWLVSSVPQEQFDPRLPIPSAWVSTLVAWNGKCSPYEQMT
jgi:hypothetical protein